MQITTELLHKYAENTVKQFTSADYTILAAYLTGSIVTESNPFLGGTTDIDLVFIHIGSPEIRRETLRLNDDIHYDIAHHAQRDYSERIALRTHPWLGPILSESITIYDPQHFMDLILASVRGLFHRPGNALQRAQTQLNSARERWFGFQPVPQDPGPAEILGYFRVLECAANAIALLVGEPLTERRFLINFPERTRLVQHPGLYPGILGMLGAHKIDPQRLSSWVSHWESIFDSLPKEGRHPRLHPHRRNYYRKAFDAILESDQPENILWPLLHTWTLAAASRTPGDPEFQNWRDAFQQIGLLGAGFTERILALDAYLEQVEAALATWEIETGA
jgi:hypothetical protein